MNKSSLRIGLRTAIPGLVLICACLAVVLLVRASASPQLEFDEKSEYSHIRIRREGNIRTLLFVRDDGKEVRQSRIDLDAPHELTFPYLRAMFASYLFKPEQERVLVVGLGGGSMVRFLTHHEPDLRVDVVEIDPVVVRLADEFFATRSGGNVNIMTVDAFDYLRNTEKRYEVIYFDAFLKPSDDTDATGVPRRLKTIEFYKSVQRKLDSEGVVAFNLNAHADTAEDIRTIESAFPETVVFACPGSSNVVVIGLMASIPNDPDLQVRAQELDRRFNANFSFEQILNDRQP